VQRIRARMRCAWRRPTQKRAIGGPRTFLGRLREQTRSGLATSKGRVEVID
jgi:hypothetical protein